MYYYVDSLFKLGTSPNLSDVAEENIVRHIKINALLCNNLFKKQKQKKDNKYSPKTKWHHCPYPSANNLQGFRFVQNITPLVLYIIETFLTGFNSNSLFPKTAGLWKSFTTACFPST